MQTASDGDHRDEWNLIRHGSHAGGHCERGDDVDLLGASVSTCTGNGTSGCPILLHPSCAVIPASHAQNKSTDRSILIGSFVMPMPQRNRPLEPLGSCLPLGVVHAATIAGAAIHHLHMSHQQYQALAAMVSLQLPDGDRWLTTAMRDPLLRPRDAELDNGALAKEHNSHVQRATITCVAFENPSAGMYHCQTTLAQTTRD